MSNTIDKSSTFNYTKTGIILGFIIGAMNTSMGVICLLNAIKKDDFSRKLSSFVLIGIGIGCISMEIYRTRKLKSKK